MPRTFSKPKSWKRKRKFVSRDLQQHHKKGEERMTQIEYNLMLIRGGVQEYLGVLVMPGNQYQYEWYAPLEEQLSRVGLEV